MGSTTEVSRHSFHVVIERDEAAAGAAESVSPLEDVEATLGDGNAFLEEGHRCVSVSETKASDDGIVLDKLARMLNEYPHWNGPAVCETLAVMLADAGREIFDGSLPENRNRELSDAEHYEANALAAYLVGKVVRDENGRVFKITDWDRLGKDGWATVGNGIYWTRPEDCTVLTGDEAWSFLSAIGGAR
jgi:hypothetical protein